MNFLETPLTVSSNIITKYFRINFTKIAQDHNKRMLREIKDLSKWEIKHFRG